MAESVYKLITVVGSSTDSWERAAAAALNQAGQSLRDLRVARVVEQDIHIEDKNQPNYRVKLEVSFKLEGK
jgi:dodecin